jgi:predicted AAA+ superfamily ATPase
MTVVKTLWGELAWQLGGKPGFERVRQDDERVTSPGDTLRKLMNDYGPCLILIDEWVATTESGLRFSRSARSSASLVTVGCVEYQ